MNLKTWMAMSREEKEAWWAKATMDQRRTLVDEGLSFEERPHPGIEFSKEPSVRDVREEKHRKYIEGGGYEYKPPRCEPALIELRNAIKQELQDESDASQKYAEMAVKFTHFSKAVKANMLQLISGQEALHRIILENIVEDITRECE